MTSNAFVATSLEAKAPDATKHVNYSLGMVLGVDDFNQEFAYLAGRDRWLARDAIGYGTLVGLRVQTEVVPSKGPRITVTSGSALTPRGQLVCVKPAQCAYLSDWITANQAEVTKILGNAPSGTIDLYLTLCYRDCPVDLVPIPGAPCRAEDELMAPSRLADDFSLELRTSPPDQTEEDVLRQFVSWLRTLNYGEGGPILSPSEFETLLRNSIQVTGLASPLSSPVSSPPSISLFFGSPLISANLDPALAIEYHRAAIRVWIQDIRPQVHAVCGCSGGCCGGTSSHDTPKMDECLLLARVEVPVTKSSGNWVVADNPPIELDESQRPMLLHLRMLQEMLGTGAGGGGLASGPQVVAAGIVGASGATLPVFNNLAATKVDVSHIRLTFGGYVQPSASPVAGSHQYIVKALPMLSPVISNPMAVVVAFDATGIVLRITRAGTALTGTQIDPLRFSIEITRIG